jgi:membrane associated rhomboid family serine protease
MPSQPLHFVLMRQPLLNAPPVVLWLIGALIALHVGRVILPPPWPDVFIEEFAFFPGRYSEEFLATAGLPQPGLLAKLLPFVGHQFLHGGFGHLAINCLTLLAFGPVVAKRMGPLKFLLFFLCCGVVAAAAHLVVFFGEAQLVVGASGAASGVLAASVRIFYGRINLGRAVPAPLFSSAVIIFTIAITAANYIGGVLNVWGTDAQGVAWVAHDAGHFAGLIAIGWVWPRSSDGAEVLDGKPSAAVARSASGPSSLKARLLSSTSANVRAPMPGKEGGAVRS